MWLYNDVDIVVMYGDMVFCSVGVSVFNTMCSELLIMSEISCPLWSPVCEYHSVECAFTSPTSIEFGMLKCGDVVSLVESMCLLLLCV